MSDVTPTRPAVLVTGASTGIGRAIARQLVADGVVVFAGVRKQADADALRADGARPVILDVTNAEQIAAAAAELRGARAEGLRLSAIINNAGIVVTAPLECVDLDRLRWQFEVNVVGQVAVTQAFLPQLREDGGRVLFIGSTSGFLTAPFVGAYAASKHAMEAVADAMRVELAPWQIPVVLIQPGAIATPIWDKSSETANADIDAMNDEQRALYATPIDKLPSMVEQRVKQAVPVEHVVRVVQRALRAKRPRHRYLVSLDAHAQKWVARWVPQWLLDTIMHRVVNT